MLLTRRMLLSLMTIYSDDDGYLFMILSTLLTLYLTIHAVIQPFKYTRVNRMEAICIFILIVVLGFVNGTSFGKGDSGVKETILALFLLLIMLTPICLVIYEVWQMWKHSKTKRVSKNHYDKIMQRRPRVSIDSYTQNEDVEMATGADATPIPDPQYSEDSDSEEQVLSAAPK